MLQIFCGSVTSSALVLSGVAQFRVFEHQIKVSLDLVLVTPLWLHSAIFCEVFSYSSAHPFELVAVGINESDRAVQTESFIASQRVMSV